MRQPVIHIGENRRQGGMALASVISVLVILSVLGGAVYRNVGTDITHSGKNAKRVRAEFAAESAIQWGLAELSRSRKGFLPFTLATHKEDGETRLQGQTARDADDGPWPVMTADFTAFPGAQIGQDANGWMYMRTQSTGQSISGGKDELLAFKAWYPNDTTLRMTGRAVVEGATAQLEFRSFFTKTPSPVP